MQGKRGVARIRVCFVNRYALILNISCRFFTRSVYLLSQGYAVWSYMMEKEMALYIGKYRIQSARMKRWDYGSDGCYFITICTKNRIHYFGQVINGEMVLSNIGRIVKKFWYEIPNHFTRVVLDQYIVMPNHIHGIVVITTPNRSGLNNFYGSNGGFISNDSVGPGITAVSGGSMVSQPTQPTQPTQKRPLTGRHNKQWHPGTVGVIINQYKRICTIQARKICPNFGWQPRFHDHIIRNKGELMRIRRYIAANPANWKKK